MATVDQLKRAVQLARAAGDNVAADEIRAQIDQQVNPLPDPTEGMSPMEKYAATIGGGMMNTVRGAAQMVGLGPNDEEVKFLRRAGDKLNRSTDMGIGPDWAPTMGSVGEFVGEVAPQMLVPGGAGVSGAKYLGMQLPKKLVGGTLRSAALAGGIQGATEMRTDDESRALHTAGGATLGAALPFAGRVLKKAARNPLPSMRARDRLYEAVTGGVEEDKVAGQVAKTVQQLKGHQQVGGIREGAAEVAGSPQLGQLADETARRGNVRGSWQQFREENEIAKADMARNALGRGGSVAEAEAARTAESAPEFKRLFAAADEGSWFTKGGQTNFEEVLADIRKNSRGSTHAQAVGDMVEAKLAEMKKTPWDARALHRFRREMSTLLKTPMEELKDGLSQSYKMAKPEVLKVMKAIDDSLDDASTAATGVPMWTPLRDKYRELSKDVTAARVTDEMGESLMAGGKRGVTDAPVMTRPGLEKALELEKKKRYWGADTPVVPQQTRDELTQLVGVEQRAEAVKKAKPVMGKEPITDQQTLVRSIRDALSSGNRGILRYAYDFLGASDARELTRLLQNPKAAAQAIEMAQRSARPLTPAMEMVLSLSARSQKRRSTEEQ